MADTRKRIRTLLPGSLLLLIGLLVLQALGYGLGFFFDPSSGLGEFASRPPPGEDDLTVALISLVGVGMLEAATLLTWSAVLLFKREATGLHLAMVVGGA